MAMSGLSLPVGYRQSLAVLACAIVMTFVSPLRAQEGQLPPMEELSLVTSDSVKLAVKYFPGTHEKETLPVIMLHGWDADESARNAQLAMAKYLQANYGYAVVVPDLRGHGQSMTAENSTEEIQKDKWRGLQLAVLIEDIEACKKFLVQKNNDGQLNIDLLALVAEKESAIHAVLWTLRDWSYLPVAGKKQGQDVKAIVMLDPVRSFNGLNGNDAYRDGLFTGAVGAGFPILVANKMRGSSDGPGLYAYWDRSRRKLDKNARHLEETSYRVENNEQIVSERNKNDKYLAQVIGDFLQTEVYDRKHDFRWQDRGLK
jgi:hypothetical protein